MMFLIFQHLTCRDPEHDTLDEFYKQLIWSFEACWLGKKPTHDWDGHEMHYPCAGDDLCGGFFFAVRALIQDLEHAYSAYDLPNPTANACCPLCPVGRRLGCNWWDFRPDAEWMNFIYNEISWLAQGHPCL